MNRAVLCWGLLSFLLVTVSSVGLAECVLHRLTTALDSAGETIDLKGDHTRPYQSVWIWLGSAVVGACAAVAGGVWKWTEARFTDEVRTTP